MTRICGLLALVLVLGLSGCVTATTPHSVDPATVRSLRVERLDLVVEPSAYLGWVDALEAYFKSKGTDVFEQHATISSHGKDPGYRAFAAARLQSEARRHLEGPLKATLAGSRPVVARMLVTNFDILSAAQGLAIHMLAGSAAANSTLMASIEFVDARTGASVLSYPATRVNTQGGHRINIGMTGSMSHDPVERLFWEYREHLLPWLVKS